MTGSDIKEMNAQLYTSISLYHTHTADDIHTLKKKKGMQAKIFTQKGPRRNSVVVLTRQVKTEGSVQGA